MRELLRQFLNMPIEVRVFGIVLIVLCICCVVVLLGIPAAILLISLFT